MVQTALYSLFLIEGDENFLATRAEVTRNHRDIARAIASGLPDLAEVAMRKVIRDGRERTSVQPAQ